MAQVARRLAQRLGRLDYGGHRPAVVEDLDPDAAEAAALAHDLGHPPFGHIAEEELNRLAKPFGGYEGNAQSFRIVTCLAQRSIDYTGLNLTRRTLNGVLKYPWLRDLGSPMKSRKWGAYFDDRGSLEFARDGSVGDERSVEAEIMDWADDLSYAVHDLDDFYRAGLLPLERLCSDRSELDRFIDSFYEDGKARGTLRPRLARESEADLLDQAAEDLFTRTLSFGEPYQAMPLQRIMLRERGSALITRYIEAFELQDAAGQGGAVSVAVDPRVRAEVEVLKQLTWFYVIERPSLASVQEGQRQIVAGLFEKFVEEINAGRVRLFPPRVIQLLEDADTNDARCRVATDYIASMTESTATTLWGRITGVAPGSIMEPSLR